MNFGVVEIPYATETVLVAWSGFCIYLALRRRILALGVSLVVIGCVQWPLIAYLGDLRLQVLADVAALCFIGTCAFVHRATLRQLHVLTPILLIAVFLALQTGRAPTIEAGAFALRAIAYPLLLAGVGALLSSSTMPWRRFALVLVWATGIVGVYMLVEKSLGVPLIDPSPTELALHGNDPNVLRENLPVSYLSDGITAEPWFRPGGPFFNPPIAGIFLGVGVYAALRWVSLRWTVLVLLTGLLASLASVARGGVLMIVVTVLTPLVVQRVGRAVTSAALLLLGGIVAIEVASQGNTAAHGLGLLEGISEALANPLGTGIGTQGFFAADQPSVEVNESWLGVLFASTGLFSLLAVTALTAWLLRQAWRKNRAVGFVDVYPLAVLLLAGLSESVGALRGTPAMWLLLGEAIRHVGTSRAVLAQQEASGPRVLWVARDHRFFGGAERVAVNLARHLGRDSRDVRLVSLETPVDGEPSLDGVIRLREGLPFGAIDLVRPASSMGRKRDAVALAVKRRLVRSMLAARLRQMMTENPSCVMVLNHNGLLGGAVTPEIAARTIVHLHASVRQIEAELARPPSLRFAPTQRVRRREARRLVKLMRSCRTVVCTSFEEAALLKRLVGHSVETIANPLPWSDGPVEPSPPSRQSGLIFVGRLSEEKRPDLAIHALGLLRDRGHETTLELVGEGPKRAALEDLTRELGVSSAVTFRGGALMTADSYRRGAILLLPSDFEASPLVVVEAISCGLPCVVTDSSSGFTRLAAETGAIRLVRRGDPGSVAEAVEHWWRETTDETRARVERSTRAVQPWRLDEIAESWRQLLELPPAPSKEPISDSRAAGLLP